jgi:hypothetical protein
MEAVVEAIHGPPARKERLSRCSAHNVGRRQVFPARRRDVVGVSRYGGFLAYPGNPI